jgi:hypothetical protein
MFEPSGGFLLPRVASHEAEVTSPSGTLLPLQLSAMLCKIIVIRASRLVRLATVLPPPGGSAKNWLHVG